MAIRRFLHSPSSQQEETRPSSLSNHLSPTPELVICRKVSWQRQLLKWSALVVAVCAMGVGLFLYGQMTAGYDGISSVAQIRDLTNENAQLRDQNNKLTSDYKTLSTQLNIERGAHKTLAKQVQELTDERNRLNQDLTFFENLFPTSGKGNQPAIRSFRIEPVVAFGTPTTWSYRILVMRNGQAQDIFTGEFRLQVRYLMNGHKVMARTVAHGNIQEPLKFQHYRRIEGRFQSPHGAKILGAVAQIMQNNKLVADSVFRP